MAKTINAAPGVKFRTVASSVRDVAVLTPPRVTESNKGGTRQTLRDSLVSIEGVTYQATQRFWSSLCSRFGISPNIFTYFDHDEVFKRINERRAGKVNTGGDVIRVVTETSGDRRRLLGLTGPSKPLVDYYALQQLLGDNDTVEATYAEGEVVSKHRLANSGELTIAGEKYEPRFCLRTPIDGWGNPSIYLELLRLICTNGATAMASAFRTEIPLGKDNKGEVTDAITRMIQTYSNDEGFAAISGRFEQAAKSWASIREARELYQTVQHACPFTTGTERTEDSEALGTEERARNMKVHSTFGGIIGDLVKIYGVTQMEGLSDRKASTLPVKCTVYDMLTFASEVGTHSVKDLKAKTAINSWIGTSLCREFDLEGSKGKAPEFKDFFLSQANAAPIKAALATKKN